MSRDAHAAWSSEPPTKPGKYWFYGDLDYGGMGCQVRLEEPPKWEYKLVDIRNTATRGCMLASTDGRFVSLDKFDPLKSLVNTPGDRGEGHIGMWRSAEMPAPPDMPKPEEWLKQAKKTREDYREWRDKEDSNG